MCVHAHFALFGLKEIDRNDLFGDLPPDCYNTLMFGMIGVMVESGAVGKMCDEAGVERTFEMQNIGPDIKALDIRNQRWQAAQLCSVLLACLFAGLRFIFPANDMDKHTAIFARMALMSELLPKPTVPTLRSLSLCVKIS